MSEVDEIDRQPADRQKPSRTFSAPCIRVLFEVIGKPVMLHVDEAEQHKKWSRFIRYEVIHALVGTHRARGFMGHMNILYIRYRHMKDQKFKRKKAA